MNVNPYVNCSTYTLSTRRVLQYLVYLATRCSLDEARRARRKVLGRYELELHCVTRVPCSLRSPLPAAPVMLAAGKHRRSTINLQRAAGRLHREPCCLAVKHGDVLSANM